MPIPGGLHETMGPQGMARVWPTTDLQCTSTCMLSHIRLFVTSWTVPLQASLSMGFSRQEYWSRLPFPTPGDLPNPGIEPTSLALAGRFFTTEPSGKALMSHSY